MFQTKATSTIIYCNYQQQIIQYYALCADTICDGTLVIMDCKQKYSKERQCKNYHVVNCYSLYYKPGKRIEKHYFLIIS